MFELGKKDGSERADAVSTSDHRHDSSSAAHSRDGSAAAGSAGREVAVIGRSIRIDGDLQGEEDLRIEGDVNGTVRLYNNTLTIGAEGKMRADVYAKSVIVDGEMEGDLFSSERVAIRKSATVLGNITAPRVSLEDGAKFKGSIEMDQAAVKSAVAIADTAAPTDKMSAKPKANGSKPVAGPKVVSVDTAQASESSG